MAHLTCVGATRTEIGGVLDRLVGAGIENVMALRGDPARGPGRAFVRTEGGFGYANDLVAYIRERHGAASASAARATPRATSSAATSTRTSRNLKTKVDAGLDFIVTQLFFDNRVYFDFVARARDAGITVPIVPGIMPIRNLASVERMTTLGGATIPPTLLRRARSLPRRRRRRRGARRRPRDRPVRRAPPRRRARHPLLHAEPIARDAGDPDRPQDRPPRVIRLFPRLRLDRTLG